MAVKNEIKVGQKWKTYMGRVVTIDRMTEKGFLVIDEAGSTYEVNERGQSDPSGFLAVDLESLVAESEFFDFGSVINGAAVQLDGVTVGNLTSFRLCDAEGNVLAQGDLAADPLADMQVRFADGKEDNYADADELASETLSALGWVFDGQCWVQPEQSNWPTAPKSALDVQQGGSHYKKLRIQPVEYIHANEIPFEEGSVIKYVTRWRDKGGVKDLEKAKHFIELLIELEAKYPRGQ